MKHAVAAVAGFLRTITLFLAAIVATNITYALASAISAVLWAVVRPHDLATIAIILVVMLLDGFAGCTRCVYWGRAYEALGGLSTVDDAPGN